MPSDFELFAKWKMHLSHLKMAEAARYLADEYDLDFDSMRGRLSRSSKNASFTGRLYKLQREEVQPIPASVARQKHILRSSKEQWEASQEGDFTRKAAFISDAHLPYMRYDAFDMVQTILGYYRPDVISAMNDSLDNKGFGVHSDNEAIYEQTWRGDFQNAISMQSNYHNALRLTLSPTGVLAQVQGNHDNWIHRYWRTHVKQNAEKLVAEYMSHLYNEDKVLQFSRGLDENALHLSEGLVWTHGISASHMITTIARSGFQKYSAAGRFKSWVQGHTHRGGMIAGDSLGYNGVWFANSGCLRNFDVRYMKQKSTAWNLGIVLCEYNPTKWEHKVDFVQFVERGDRLIAKFDGATFDVPLNDSRPEYML